MRTHLVVLGAAVSVAVGCGQKPQTSPPIKVGVITSMTGVAANPRNLEAVQLAVEQINAAGGVNGSELEIESRDDTSVTDAARAAATELVELGVPVIFGPVNSTRFLAASEVTIAAKRVQIGGAATSPLVTAAQDDGYLFRTVSSDTNQGRLVATRAKAKGFANVAVIHAPTVYGQGLADAFESNFSAGGGTVTKFPIVEGQASYSDIWNSVFAVTPKPQAVFIIVVTKDGSQLVKDYAQHLSTGAFLFMSDSLNSNDFVQLAGSNSFSFQHELVAQGMPQTPQFTAFANAYAERYSAQPQGNPHNFYDAVYLTALAMTAAGSSEPAAIRDSLTTVSRGPGTLYGAGAYEAAVDDLKEGKDIDYDGASGNVDFDDAGDVISGYSIRRIVDGQFQTLEAFVQP